MTARTVAERELDAEVVAAAHARQIAGVRIDLNLGYPSEQMWVVYGPNDWYISECTAVSLALRERIKVILQEKATAQ